MSLRDNQAIFESYINYRKIFREDVQDNKPIRLDGATIRIIVNEFLRAKTEEAIVDVIIKYKQENFEEFVNSMEYLALTEPRLYSYIVQIAIKHRLNKQG